MQRFFGFSVAAVAAISFFTASASACHRGHRHHGGGCATSCCAPVTSCCQATTHGQPHTYAVAATCGSCSQASCAPVVSSGVVVGSPGVTLPRVAMYPPAR